MAWRYSGLTLILILLVMLLGALGTGLEILSIQPDFPVDEPVVNDPESIFARGGRLPITCADISVLEMIRGVSHRIAVQLVAKRKEISARGKHESSGTGAFELARGVGPATATTLARFFQLEGECTDHMDFEPFEYTWQGLKE